MLYIYSVRNIKNLYRAHSQHLFRMHFWLYLVFMHNSSAGCLKPWEHVYQVACCIHSAQQGGFKPVWTFISVNVISRLRTTTLKHSMASKLWAVAGELLKLLNPKLMTLSESLQRKSLRLAWGAMLGDIDVMFSVWRNHRSACFKVVSDCQTIRLFKRDNNAADCKQMCGGIDALVNQRAVGFTHIDLPSSGLQHPLRH